METNNLRPTFQSPYVQFKEHTGKKFTVIRPLTKDEVDEEIIGELYIIELETGERIHAWSEEIFEGVSNFNPEQ